MFLGQFNLENKMKNLDLNKFGVPEMNAGEMSTVDGGILPLVVMVGIWAIQCGICTSLISIYASQKQR